MNMKKAILAVFMTSLMFVTAMSASAAVVTNVNSEKIVTTPDYEPCDITYIIEVTVNIEKDKGAVELWDGKAQVTVTASRFLETKSDSATIKGGQSSVTIRLEVTSTKRYTITARVQPVGIWGILYSGDTYAENGVRVGTGYIGKADLTCAATFQYNHWPWNVLYDVF